jgi:hypothetical protein
VIHRHHPPGGNLGPPPQLAKPPVMPGDRAVSRDGEEHRQHLELAENYAKIAVAYTQVATIATDDHHTLQEFRASVGAQWPFLSDPERTVQRDLDIQEYTDPEHDPMIPHTLVLKAGLVIHSVYNGYWFWGRPSFYDLWRDLRTATAEIRPDWDPSTPGLREAWDAGDYSKFHGWDRQSPQSTPNSDVDPRKGWTRCRHRCARCSGSNSRSSWRPWSPFPNWPRRFRTPTRSAR